MSNSTVSPTGDKYIPPRDRAALDTDEAALYIGLSPNSLKTYRSRGTGPNYSKLGKKAVYRPRDLEKWVNDRLVSKDRGRNNA